MAYLRDILIALLTPWGRLSQMPFIVLSALLLSVHGGLQAYLNAHIEDLPAYNPYSMAQIVTLWMFFSILSRRFHDSGNAALLLIPYFAMTFAAYLFALDNWKLALSPFEEDHDTAAWFERVRMAYQLLGFGVIIFALKDVGDDAGNNYGPPFAAHDRKPTRTLRTAESRAHDGHGMTARRVTTVPVEDTEPEPQHNRRASDIRRGRITPTEPAGRHHGFGRR